MKKFFYSFFAAVALMLAATSCSQEEMVENGTSGNDVEVSFNVDMEGPQASRAIGDGTTAKYLYFGAYLKEGNDYNYVSTLQPSNWPAQGRMQFVDKKANIKLRLVKGQTYKFVFWAQSEDGNTYYNVDFAAKKISAVYNVGNTASANNENRDAFYAAEEFTINGPLTETITLKRPFAQVNVGIKIGELNEAKAAGIEIAKSSFTFSNVPTELNVLTGVASNEQKVIYHATNIPEADKTDNIGDLKKVENTDYEYIAMNYIFAGGRANVTSTSFTVETDNKVVNTYTVPNLPVERNYRTNIIASIMSDAEFNIVIDPIFAGDIIYPNKQEEALVFAALNGGEVTLTEPLTLTSPLNVSADMVLNLNNQTLTGSLNLAKDATLIVNNGSIVNTDESTSGIVSNGDLTLNNVKITSARHALRIESGDVVIDGGTYEVVPKSIKTLHALNVGDNGTTANVIIKNGTFIGPKGKGADSGSAVHVYNGSTVTIEGGNYSGGLLNTLSNKGKLVVTGGTFDQDPSAYVAEGYSSKKTGDWYFVGKPVSSVEDLKDIVNNASSVNIEGDINNGTNVFTIRNNDVVINMNNETITAGGGGTNNYAFNVYGSDVVVNDANLDGAGFAVLDESNVTINSGQIAAKPGKSGRNMFYVVNNSVVTVNEGTYTIDRTSCYFVYVDAGSTCYINGGHFEKKLSNSASKDSFVNSASTGTVIITGGTFNVDPTKWLAEGYKAVKSGTIWTVSAE